MKSSEVKRKHGSLSDYCLLRAVDSEGVISFSDGALGFVLSVNGIDALVFESHEFAQLHERWRSFLHLKPEEEIQIVFRKTGLFEKTFQTKLKTIEGVQSPLTKRLFWAQLEENLRDVEGLQLQEVSIHIIYRLNLNQKSVETAQQNNNQILIKREEVEQRLQTMGLQSERLLESEIRTLMASSANGLSYLPMSDGEEWPAITIEPGDVRINSELFRVVALKKLPESYSELGMIQALTLLPIPLELSIRFRGKNLEPVKRKIEKRRQVLFGLSSHKATGDPLAEAQFKEADEVLRRLNEQNDSLCEMSLVAGVRGKDETFLRRSLTEIFSSGNRMQQVEFEESPLATFDGFLETIPCFKGEIFHKHSVLSSNAIHFLPFFKPSLGDERPIITFKTQYGSLFSIDPTAQRLANYNWLVSGQSGAGKSFFVNSLLEQSLLLNPRIFIVDIGGSYNKLTLYLEGKLVHVDTDTRFSIGPFFMPASSDEKEERRRRAHIRLIFQEMLRDEGKLPSVEERALLHEALEPLFNLPTLPAHPITEVKKFLENLHDDKAKRLALLLKPWCAGEFFGTFVDHPEPLQIEDDIITFDLKGLKEFPDLSRVLELIITSAVWGALRSKDRFTWVVLDEVAFSLLKTQPGFVQELVSTCRKMWAGTVIVVQGLETLTTNPAGASILANTNFKAILSQRGDARGYEEPLGLRESEAQVIRSLSRKKGEYSEIFLMDDDRRSLIKYSPDPITYLLSTTDPQEVMALENGLKNLSGSYSERILKLVEGSAS